MQNKKKVKTSNVSNIRVEKINRWSAKKLSSILNILILDSLINCLVLKTFIVEEDLSLDAMVTVGLEYSLKKGWINNPVI